MNVEDLGEETRQQLHGHVLSLVDTKSLLGYRYLQQIYATPSIEDANTVQGLAADEFGQADQFQNTLSGLDVEADDINERTDPEEYYNLDVLDVEPTTWVGFLARVGVADLATQIKMESFKEGDLSVLSNPATKAVREEEYHARYLKGAFELYVDESTEFAAVVTDTVPSILQWFGADSEANQRLVDAGVLGHSPEQLRQIFLATMSDIDETLGLGLPIDRSDGGWVFQDGLDWQNYDHVRLRATPGGPEKAAIAAVTDQGIV